MAAAGKWGGGRGGFSQAEPDRVVAGVITGTLSVQARDTSPSCRRRRRPPPVASLRIKGVAH